jgi:alanyl-tRNA synthetase
VQFLGYDQLELRDSHVVKHRTVMLKGQPQYQLVLNRTPFYPEGGGQVGDTGWLEFSGEKIRVLDTKKDNNLVIHIVEKLPHFLQDPTVHSHVDERKRRLTENNHSATHLLHAALRKVLGHHVQQKGSYLDDQTLRFDFAHFQKVTDEELGHRVGDEIREHPQHDAREQRDVFLVFLAVPEIQHAQQPEHGRQNKRSAEVHALRYPPGHRISMERVLTRPPSPLTENFYKLNPR